MSKKNILAEAIADSKQLKQAAMANAQALILESMKENLKEMVEEQMNEMSDETVSESEDVVDDEDTDEEPVSEGTEMEINETEDFDLDDLDGGEEVESGEEEDDLAGLSEADLQEALASALNEVDHGKMGDLRDVGIDDHHDPITGADKKEAGWDEKTAPAKQDWTVKENAYKRQVAKLVSENTMLKKTNQKLRATVSEVNLFNTKLHYAHKLLNKEGLAPSAKKAIIAKMDGVKTVAEAKTLYESLELALGALSENKKPAKKQTSLSEALGVHGASQGKNVSEVRELVGESNPFDRNRMQVLAGMNKK